MIVFKHNDTVYIVRSRWGISGLETDPAGQPMPENVAMWHPSGRRNRLIACAGVGRITDLVRYENIFPKVLNQKSLFIDSYNKIADIAARYGLYSKNTLPIGMVFAEEDEAYLLHFDGAVEELEDIYCDSICESMIISLYDKYGVNDPKTFVKRAFSLIEKVSRNVMFPAVIMNTKNNKLEVIER